MSFGYSVGDVVAIGTLAWNVYKSCKDAPESFKNISQEVSVLHLVTKEFEETLSDQTLSTTQRLQLQTVGDGCRSTLEDLQKLIDKYDRLGTKSRRTWDRMGWGSQPIVELRARLTSNTVLLTAFISTSQIVTHQKLNKFLQEYQDGKYESSVVSYQTAESLNTDDKETWREIRKELEGIGMTVAALEANKDFIIHWLQDALAAGAFEEKALDGISSHSALDDNYNLSLGIPGRPVPKPLAIDTPSMPAQLNGQSNTHVLPNEQYTEASIPGRSGLSPRHWSTSETSGGIDERLGVGPHRSDLVNANEESKKGRQRKTRRASRLTAVLGRLNIRSRESLYEAAAYGKLSKVMTLLQDGADIEANVEGMTSLCVAAQNGNYEIVKYLLQSGANVNAWSNAQWVALDEKYILEEENRLPLLMNPVPETGALPLEQTALHAAALAGHIDVLKILLEYGADANIGSRNYGNTPLHLATQLGRKNMIALLLESTTDIDRPNTNGATVLSFAVDKEYKDIAVMLLENGADVNRENAIGMLTVLHLAVNRGNRNIAELLLRKGADVNRCAPNGTALHVAVQRRLENIIVLLLQNGADMNVIDHLGRTALFIAVESGLREIIELLQRNWANPFIQDIENRTPKQQAILKPVFPELVSILTVYEETWLQNLQTINNGIEQNGEDNPHIDVEIVEAKLPNQPRPTTAKTIETKGTEIILTATEGTEQ